jgi:putative GTP pyrophosphokinase
MTASSPPSPFDFESHGRAAVQAYQRVRPLYEALAFEVQRILRQCLAASKIQTASIEARAKSLDSFASKASLPSESDPEAPRYPDPLSQITDLAAVRVITFFTRTVSQVDEAIRREFDVVERVDKAASLWREGRLGYQSVHYLVRLGPNRLSLGEYQHYRDLIVEIQVRTVMQHAWAEIEHDIQYKAIETIPDQIRRRFVSLAGLLEIADREFQAIQDDDERLRNSARESVNRGELQQVEITGDALRAYLDKKLGPDGRMVPWSYEFTARILRQLGFSSLDQVDECIAGYDDDRVSRIAFGARQGQLTRFECMLLAGMGDHYLSRHPWRNESWWPLAWNRRLQDLIKAGIRIKNYDPTPSPVVGIDLNAAV